MMKYPVFIFGVLALCLVTAEAQVSSHLPTAHGQQSPAQSAPSQPFAPDKAVARVNGSVLTAADLLREEYTIFPYARQHNGLPKELEPQIREGAMKMLVFEELVYQETLRRKMTVPPSSMQQAEKDFGKQFHSPDEFNAVLQQEFHGSPRLLEDKIRRSLLIDAFLRQEIENRSSVSPADVQAFYQKNPAVFHHSETFTIQTISILPPPNASATQLKEGRARADQAQRQARLTKTSEDFGLLAEKVSDDDYRVMMGQHKPMPVEQIPPQVLKQLRVMKVGDVSDSIQVDQIWTIVRLDAHNAAGEAKFDEVKTQLAKEMQQNKTNQLRAALDQRLRQSAKIEEF